MLAREVPVNALALAGGPVPVDRGAASQALRHAEKAGRLPDLLAQAREDGYSLSLNDNHAGVAAPLVDPVDEAVLGSIAIAGPDSRLPRQALLRLATPPRVACADLAPRLTNVMAPGRRCTSTRST